MMIRFLSQSRPPYPVAGLLWTALNLYPRSHEKVSGLQGTNESVRWIDWVDLKLAHVACYAHRVDPDPAGLDHFVRMVLTTRASIDAAQRQAYADSGKEYPPSSRYPGPKSKDVILYWLVRVLRPRLVVETGVDQGISSRFMLQALAENGYGELVSMDPASITESGRPVGWLVTPDLRSRWTFINRTSQVALRECSGEVDIFFHDSLHSYDHMMFEFEWALDRLRPGGLMVSDDINMNHAFRDFTHRHTSRLSVLSSTVVGMVVCHTAESSCLAPHSGAGVR